MSKKVAPWHKIAGVMANMRTKALLSAAILLLASTILAQKTPEKPKLHLDFHLGTYPFSRDAIALIAKENVRLLLVGFHQNWSVEKIAKESKAPEDDLDRLFADLEDGQLASEIDQWERRPGLPIIRDRDIAKIERSLGRHTQEYSDMLRNHWAEIEAAVTPLAGAKGIAKPQLLYQAVVGGILFGGMNDAFFADQTLMVNPPRRTGSQRYYAWLVESDPKLAGVLKREQWQSDDYTVVSIGPKLPENRTSLDRIRMENGMVLDEAEARRFRSFVAIFTKEKLLPYFKKNRSEFRDALDLLDAGRYASLSAAFAWYYDQMANGAAEKLTAARLIQPPTEAYAYALKIPQGAR